MAILQAVLATSSFTEGADKMIDSMTRLFQALDHSFRAMQKFEITISTFSGNLDKARVDLDKLYGISNDLGVSFESAAAPFAKFASAATGLEKSQIFDIFESFAVSLSAVRANGSEVNGVFLALQQIVSKGKLSMEELRLQLAERIPGAMTLAAQAAGLSMGDFEKAVQTGTINTSEWLVDFAALLKSTFGDAAELAAQSFDAAVQRMSNKMFKFNADLVAASGASEIWVDIIDELTQSFFDSEFAFGASGKMLQDLSNIAKDFIGLLEPFVPGTLSLMVVSLDLLARTSAFLTGTFQALVSGFYALTAAILGTIKDVKLLNPFLDETSYSIIALTKDIEEAVNNSDKYLFKSADAFSRMKQPFELVEKSVKKIADETSKISDDAIEQVKKLETFSKELKNALTEDLKEHEKAAEDKEKTIEGMYETAGFGADAYYDNEAKKLVEQVAEWQAAGADIYKSNEYLYNELEKLSAEAWEKGETTAGQALDAYSVMADSLVQQLNEEQSLIDQWVNEVASTIDGVDGSKINITADLDGGMVVSGINELMDKFNQLKNAAQQSKDLQTNTTYDPSQGSYEDFLKGLKGSSYDNSNTSNSSTLSITNNFNQNLSKSDVSDITTQQQREASRR